MNLPPVSDRDINKMAPAFRNALLREFAQSDPPILLKVADQPVYLYRGVFLGRAALLGRLLADEELTITHDNDRAEIDSRIRTNFSSLLESIESAEEVRNFSGLIHAPQVMPCGGRYRLAPRGPCPPLKAYVLESPPMLPTGCRGYLAQWLSGLRFTNPVHHGRLTAWAVALLARAHCSAFPHLLVTSEYKSCGKTRLATALSLFLTGKSNLPSINYTGGEQEMETRIGTMLANAPSPALFVVDNIRAKLGGASEVRSQWLSTSATRNVVWGRVMYKGMAPISYPTAILNGVDSAVESDLNDKVWPVMLTLPEGTQFYYPNPDPEEFVREHRLELLSEALDLLAEVDLTQPFTYTTRFPTFERIVTHVAGRLALPFQTVSPHTVDGCVIELYNLVSGTPQPITEIVRAIRENGESLRELKAFMINCRQATEAGRAGSLRYWIQLHYVGKTYHYQGRAFQFVLDKDSAGQYTLGIKDIEK